MPNACMPGLFQVFREQFNLHASASFSLKTDSVAYASSMPFSRKFTLSLAPLTFLNQLPAQIRLRQKPDLRGGKSAKNMIT